MNSSNSLPYARSILSCDRSKTQSEQMLRQLRQRETGNLRNYRRGCTLMENDSIVSQMLDPSFDPRRGERFYVDNAYRAFAPKIDITPALARWTKQFNPDVCWDLDSNVPEFPCSSDCRSSQLGHVARNDFDPYDLYDVNMTTQQFSRANNAEYY